MLATILGPTVAIPYLERQLPLGTWQRIILVERDGPPQRTLHLARL
ncbi:MAG: YjbQ family protein [Ktedonobacterales bacterium]|nr:YjbQ family protein [Ktedonobacterales bacterium]